MPSPPEITRILREERLTEILRQWYTEDLATSHDDIHTSGKLHI